MRYIQLAVIAVMAAASGIVAGDSVGFVTHTELQAVNQYGSGTYTATDKVIFEGIVINSPEEMLDPTPGGVGMGGQWQVYVQGEGDDHAGTAVWFGQNYGIVTSGESYTEQEYLDELYRINHDPNTAYVFNVGDRVRVAGSYKFYKGKTNLNEKHEVDPYYDFQIELVTPAAGVPTAESVSLNMLKDGNNDYIFDPNRVYGCEYYQGRLVRVENVTITDPEKWGPGETLTLSDNSGRTFDLLLGRGEGFTRYECPEGVIDVIGILDQEATTYFPCMDGYRLWVTNYDGNGLVLTDRGYQRGNLGGDINGDYTVDLMDLAEMSRNWLEYISGL